MKAQGYKGWLKIHERERLSDRPFGKHTSRGKFRFEIDRVPFYNVPDLTGFKLKPYVPHQTPRIPEEKAVVRQVALTDELKANIQKMVDAATSGQLEAVAAAGGMHSKKKKN